MRYVITLPGIAEANRKLDLLLGGGVIPTLPTLANTLGTSSLKPAEVAGAMPLLVDFDRRLTALGY